MRKLVIIQDSPKQSLALKVRSAPAIEAFEGEIFREINEARARGKFPFDIDVLILTPRYGFRSIKEPVSAYSEAMTVERAHELREEAIDYLLDYVKRNRIAKVYVLLGASYRDVIRGFEERCDAEVEYLAEKSPIERLHEIIAGED